MTGSKRGHKMRVGIYGEHFTIDGRTCIKKSKLPRTPNSLSHGIFRERFPMRIDMNDGLREIISILRFNLLLNFPSESACVILFFGGPKVIRCNFRGELLRLSKYHEWVPLFTSFPKMFPICNLKNLHIRVRVENVTSSSVR